MQTDIFERKSAPQPAEGLIAADLYNLIIGTVLLWGFAINWLIIRFVPAQMILQRMPSAYLLFLVGYFASCFFGIFLCKKSTNPLVSFIGYNFIVVPFGLVINIVVSAYEPALVLGAVGVTGGVTMIMMILGVLFPRFFERIIGALTIALLAVIVVELGAAFLFGVHPGILDWIVALIFCGYIGYDWSRAQRLPKTVDNAVDSAAALYMDIINLFLRLLRILGRRR